MHAQACCIAGADNVLSPLGEVHAKLGSNLLHVMKSAAAWIGTLAQSHSDKGKACWMCREKQSDVHIASLSVQQLHLGAPLADLWFYALDKPAYTLACSHQRFSLFPPKAAAEMRSLLKQTPHCHMQNSWSADWPSTFPQQSRRVCCVSSR